MSINPENISTLRVGQLPPNPFGLKDKLPHEIGTDLTQGTVQQLADTIAAYIGAVNSIAFNPIVVSDGQTLPNSTNPEWILVGPGTYLNINGGANITTTELLNALVFDGTIWSLAVEIPIVTPPIDARISQSVNEGVVDWSPSEDAVFKAIQDRVFLNAVGSFHYSDLATQTTPINIVSGVETKLTNDTLGAFTKTSNAPFGVSTLWNPTTNRFDFSQLSVGDSIRFRPDLNIDLAGTNTSFSLYMKMAIGSGSEWTLVISNSERKSTDAFNDVHFVGFDIAYEDVKNYPAEIYIKTDANATVKVNGWYFDITRKNINIVEIQQPQGDYAKLVYFNFTNPNSGSATIFDDVNPPVTNDNSLKANASNLYIGTDASTWVWDNTLYKPQTVAVEISNFTIEGTSLDSGADKIDPIERQGSIKAPKFITAGGTASQVVSGTGSLLPISSLVTIDATPTDNSNNAVSSNGVFDALATKANADGTILYYAVKWFTPTGNVSTSGTTVTSVGTQFLSSMVGAKITISGESRIITAFTSTTVVTVDSAFSTNYSGVLAANWGVFARGLVMDSSGLVSLYIGLQSGGAPAGATILSSVGGLLSTQFGFIISDNSAYFGNPTDFRNTNVIRWSSGTTYGGTKDIGIRRNAAGLLELYNGVTADGNATNRRDLLLRNLQATKLLVNGASDNGVDAIQVNGTIKASPAYNPDQVVILSQLNNQLPIISLIQQGGNLKRVCNIPTGTTAISYSFFENEKIQSVTFPTGLLTIGNNAFIYNLLTSVTIPSSVTSLGEYAFSNNQLTSVTIPNSITIISDGVFQNNQLTSVTIPNSVTSIGQYAFESNNLTAVTLPATCTYYANSFDGGVTITGGILI